MIIMISLMRQSVGLKLTEQQNISIVSRSVIV